MSSNLPSLRLVGPPSGGTRQVGLLVASALGSVACLLLLAFAIEPPLQASVARSPVTAASEPRSAIAQARQAIPSKMAASLISEIVNSDVQVALNPAKPFFFKGNADAREYSVSCLAAAAWYEAGPDSSGQRAVMQVVLNRLRNSAFPKTVCGVVFQGSERKTGCQFTFTCDGSLIRRSPSERAWSDARVRAQAALDGEVDAQVADATHYHADYVTPWWSKQLARLATVGRHIFYKWGDRRSALTGAVAGGGDGDKLLVARLSGDNANQLPLKQPLIEPTAGLAETFVPSVDTVTFGGAMGAAQKAGSGGRFHSILVDGSSPAGRLAVTALTKCAGTKGCTVAAYGSPAVGGDTPTGATGGDGRPVFLFVRDPSSGMDVALWDCSRMQREDPTQCLPTNQSALDRLLRINRN